MIVIGIAGGSGSGKSTFADLVGKNLNETDLTVLRHDSFYRPLDHLSLEERKGINFDHPDSMDTPLMIECIDRLRDGKPARIPEYDYANHTRKSSFIEANPTAILIVEGILIFADAALRARFDIKIFIDTDGDDRLMRRIERDIKERGRSLDGVLEQYRKTVKPMHLEFVEPSKRWADIIIPHGGRNEVGLDLVNSKLHHLLKSDHA